MPPAFVLSQDQTLRKYLTKGFSSSSLIHCSVASFKALVCFAWLFNFQRTGPPLSATAHLYYHRRCLSVKNFFQIFSGSFALGVDVLLSTIGYYTRLLRFRQYFFHDFLQKLFRHGMTRELALPDEHLSLAGDWKHANFHRLALVKITCVSFSAQPLSFYRSAHKKAGAFAPAFSSVWNRVFD